MYIVGLESIERVLIVKAPLRLTRKYFTPCLSKVGTKERSGLAITETNIRV